MASSTQVTVYVKKDCGLCGPLWETVQKVNEEVDFDAEKIDISGDSALMKRYGQEVPVVLINGRKAFKGKMSEKAFRKKLKRVEQHAPDVEALELLEPDPYVPPVAVIVLVLALALGAAGYFLAQGFSQAELGRGRLAATLFRVEQVKSDRAVDFDLPTYDGKTLGLDDFRGKVVFINFWATWCPPCVEEMPSMKRFYQRMKDDPRFVMLAISADEDWKPVREFFEKSPPPFPVLLDKSGALAKKYGTEKFPETYVVIDGRIVGYIVGPRDWDAWYADAYAEGILEHGEALKRERLAVR